MKDALTVLGFFALCLGAGAGIGAAIDGGDGAFVGLALGAVFCVITLYVFDASLGKIEDEKREGARSLMGDDRN